MFGCLRARLSQFPAIPRPASPPSTTVIRLFTTRNVIWNSAIGNYRDQVARRGGASGPARILPADEIISDVTHQILQTQIAKDVGIKYLSKAIDSEAKAQKIAPIIHGYLFGEKSRWIVPLVVSHLNGPYWVFFLLDSGSPTTFFSEEASKVLGFGQNNVGTLTQIAGRDTPAEPAPEGCFFSQVNLLGTDFCRLNGVYKVEDYRMGKVQLCFGGGWDLMEKATL
ncbi:hypothetical protein B9Z19DRAFT_1128504 [Tuber borchii]|uniref:Uncharacterized protein n=1 Tax=Tuber borchii TaxID=42251 RepID=A0A2T6ZP35_TUBBO|nr:hypothetical protein B9Z19DRAFT_1128504 [Tuber borchii]